MGVKLINVGYGNFVSADRLISIVGPESAPVKRIVQEAREGHTPSSTHPAAAAPARCLSWTAGTSCSRPCSRNRGAPAR